MGKFGCWAAAMVMVAALHPGAAAKEKSGLAIGGEAGAVNNGLSLKYAVGNFHVQLVVGLDVFITSDVSVAPSTTVVATTVRATYNVARTDWTNLYVGLGGTFAFGTSALATTIEALLGVEHFFNEWFSVSGMVSIPVRINPDLPSGDVLGQTAGAGTGVSIRSIGWGAGFHFYF